MTDPAEPTRAAPHLLRVLGLFSATTLVVGEVIGSGIFFKPHEVAQALGGYVGLILALWVVCGLINLCGALTLAELSAMFPQEGGTYVFLRETYGRMWAFLWCWSEFWVIRTGAIAALAVYTTISLQDLLAGAGVAFSPAGWKLFNQLAAIGFISLFGAINIAGTIWGGRVQNVMTIIKVTFVLFLGALPFVALKAEPVELGPLFPANIDGGLLANIAVALAAIMWAYDGWGNVTVVAEEIRDPERNIPRALIGGMLLLIALYFGANLAYHLTLPVSEIAAEQNFNPARAVCEKLLPGFGSRLLLAMLMISLLGALNGNILVGPRVLYAVARDFEFLSPLRRLNKRTQTPARAIALMCGWAILLILLADLSPRKDTPLYTWLTIYCVFGGSIFYFSAVLAVFVQRWRRPNAPRAYRVWGYPITPALFVSFYAFFLGSMVWTGRRECLLGLSLIAIGLIVYVLVPQRWKQKRVDEGMSG